jgi:hypothetical protein
MPKPAATPRPLTRPATALAALGLAALPAAPAAAQHILFDNGGFITHPGQGFNGADASQADPAFASLGDPVYATLSGAPYAGFEDFIVPSGEEWTVERIRFYVWVQSGGGPLPVPPFSQVAVAVWRNDPRLPSNLPITGSNDPGPTPWTGAYRVPFEGLSESTRPIYAIEARFNDVPPRPLTPGEYWIQYTVFTGTPPVHAFTPYVMDGQVNALGNAAVATPMGWTPTVYNGRGVAHPIQVEGVRRIDPACYANCDSSTFVPVLNVADFTCFVRRFSAAVSGHYLLQPSHYANCDQSTAYPTLTVADFTCFLHRFAAGCP